MAVPLVTVAVPSFNQGEYLEDALASIFEQGVPVEVFVLDAGSTDNSLDVIRKWEKRLTGWRSHPDDGQAAAINEGIAQGRAPYVCWLNSDDYFLPDGLVQLVKELENRPDVPAVYGQCWNVVQKTGKRYPVWVEAFDERRLTMRCIISQPATLIRRSAWEGVGGLNEALDLAMDYDLWWRLFNKYGPLTLLEKYVAVNRIHDRTKTKNYRREHNREAIEIVRKHHGRAPLIWWLKRPYSIWLKSII